jgi:hypothetical protein
MLGPARDLKDRMIKVQTTLVASPGFGPISELVARSGLHLRDSDGPALTHESPGPEVMIALAPTPCEFVARVQDLGAAPCA